ncbi:radical SAM/SPASM domain-containing protein [Clostridium cellulovorans]|uniref:Radical SAM domain protein n=1 Tax=Clostridium cellulovorans (strain ATCC 35296 / DSM 3052 / OCM 3 / 743B) TaxID=573061 RepID=D9ST92_CLOC7|nr:radical SAM protein [Clostridium cellulovorans]ADL50708.1 Radical SAM domain protein [Clostridium cellulovorans 743B]
MREDYYPLLKDTVRIKKMPSGCWVVDLVADNGAVIHPFEAFALSLCTGEYTLENLKYIFSSVFSIEKSDYIDTIFNKLDRYIIWKDKVSACNHKYDPKTFLYDIKTTENSSKNRFDSPGEMTIILTHNCNFRCIYCFNNSGEAKTVQLNTNEWLEVIKQARELGIVKCTVSGGEPMLHPGFFDILRAITDSGMSVYICTNGSLVDENVVKQFKEIGLPCVQFSLDAGTPEIHDKMATVKGTYPKVINAIKLLVGAGIDVYIKSVITPVNYSDISNLIDLCSELGVKQLVLDRFDLSNAGRGGTELFMTRKQELDLEDLVQTKIKELSGKMILKAATVQRCWSGEDNIVVCGAFRRSINILPNGDISVCEKLIEVPEMTAGNVKDNTLEEIWNSKKVSDIVNPSKDIIDEPCKTCEHLDHCHTGCYALSLLVSENPYSIDPRCWKGNYSNKFFMDSTYERI